MDNIFSALDASCEERQKQLERYLRVPSVSSDPRRASSVEQCAHFTARLLQQAGMEQVAVHATQGHPLVIGSWKKAPNRPTARQTDHRPTDPATEAIFRPALAVRR